MNTGLCAVVAVLAVPAIAWAQPQLAPARGDEPRGGFVVRSEGGPQRGDMMMENFFPPELVMRHQEEIALTPDQQTAIRSDLSKSVADATDLQWRLSAEEEAMEKLLKPAHPDEKAVLAQLDKLLTVEHDLKRIQLGMLVRIKNILTPEQQAKLTELKQKAEPRMMGGMRGGLRGMRMGGPGNQEGSPPLGVPGRSGQPPEPQP